MALVHVLLEQKIHEADVRTYRYRKEHARTKAPELLHALDTAFLASVWASPDETEPSGRV